MFGAWAILIGVIVAIVLAIFQKQLLISYSSIIYVLLASLGVVVGFLSVSSDSKDAVTFLWATVALVIVSSLGQQRLIIIGEVGSFIVAILDSLLIMFIPATIIVALKTVFSVAYIK